MPNYHIQNSTTCAASYDPRPCACNCVQVAKAALEMLGVLHEDAAAQNDKLHLFASEEQFQRVFQLAAELAEAEAALEGLLPGLRKLLGLPRLAYISLANQGDYLIEVPADRRDVPKVGVDAALHCMCN